MFILELACYGNTIEKQVRIREVRVVDIQ